MSFRNQSLYDFAMSRMCCRENLKSIAEGLPCRTCVIAASPKPSGYTRQHRDCGGRCRTWWWVIKEHYHWDNGTPPPKENWPEDEEAQKAEIRKDVKDLVWQHVLGCCEGVPVCPQCNMA